MDQDKRKKLIEGYYRANNALMEIGIIKDLPKELDEIILDANRAVVKIVNWINDNRGIPSDKNVEVCDKCMKASCWYGEFMCDEAYDAGTTIKTVKELRELKVEHEDYWSDEKMIEVYGEPAPFNKER